MNQTEFQKRREIENILALVANAEDALNPVLTRMVQRAKTQPESIDISQLLGIKEMLEKAKNQIADLHPDRLPRKAK